MYRFNTPELACPKCGYPQYCPCDNCKDRLPTEFKPWIYQPDGNSIACAGCGFIESIDYWEDLAFSVYKNRN